MILPLRDIALSVWLKNSLHMKYAFFSTLPEERMKLIKMQFLYKHLCWCNCTNMNALIKHRLNFSVERQGMICMFTLPL